MPIIQEYAKHLKTHLLKELAAEELTLLRQMDVPLLRLLSLKPESEIVQWLLQRETAFLSAMEAGRAKEWDIERLHQWEQDAIPGIPKGGLHASDVILFHTAQRSALLRFVARFTTDPNKKVQLLGEIEAHFTAVLAEALETYQRMGGTARPVVAAAPAAPKGPAFRGPVPRKD